MRSADEISVDATSGAVNFLFFKFLREARNSARRMKLRSHLSRGPDQLHDFRVALRKLRCICEAYGDFSRGPIKNSLKPLRSMARDTNRARDLEVVIEWLRQAKGLAKRWAYPGLNYLIKYHQKKLDKEYAFIGREIIPHFKNFAGKLEMSREDAEKDQVFQFCLAPDSSFSRFTSDLIQKRIQNIENIQKLAINSNSEILLHRIRIEIKKARYLCEPFLGDLAVDEVISQLKNIQNFLGEIHDRHLLISSIASILCKLKSRPVSSVRYLTRRKGVLKSLEITCSQYRTLMVHLNSAEFDGELGSATRGLQRMVAKMSR